MKLLKKFSLKFFIVRLFLLTVLLFVFSKFIFEYFLIIDGRTERTLCLIHKASLLSEKIQVTRLPYYSDKEIYFSQIQKMYFPDSSTHYYDLPSKIDSTLQNRFVVNKAKVKYCPECRKTEALFKNLINFEAFRGSILGLRDLKDIFLTDCSYSIGELFREKEDMESAKIYILLILYNFSNTDKEQRMDAFNWINYYKIGSLSTEELEQIRKKLENNPYPPQELINLTTKVMKNIELTIQDSQEREKHRIIPKRTYNDSTVGTVVQFLYSIKRAVDNAQKK